MHWWHVITRMSNTIPRYALYGDEAQPAWLDMVHMEWIHERSSLFDYEIAPHLHEFFQEHRKHTRPRKIDQFRKRVRRGRHWKLSMAPDIR